MRKALLATFAFLLAFNIQVSIAGGGPGAGQMKNLSKTSELRSSLKKGSTGGQEENASGAARVNMASAYSSGTKAIGYSEKALGIVKSILTTDVAGITTQLAGNAVGLINTVLWFAADVAVDDDARGAVNTLKDINSNTQATGVNTGMVGFQGRNAGFTQQEIEELMGL